MDGINKCPVCGSTMGKGAKACEVCGTAFEADNLCPFCSGPIDLGATRCPHCGKEFESGNPDAQKDLDPDVVERIDSPTPETRGEAESIAKSVYVDVELEELVKLPAIGPLRAKILFDAGYTDLRKLKQASVVELMNIRGIGRKAAGEIKTALRELSLEEIREIELTEETVGAEHQCPLCATVVSAYETSCYECGCNFEGSDIGEGDSDRLALSYYDSKLLRSPGDKDLWYARGATLAKMGSYEQAINSFDKVLEIDPSFQTAWMSKAEVYNKLGDSSKAAECYSHIITSASGGKMPGLDSAPAPVPEFEDEDDIALEPPPPHEETEAKEAVAESPRIAVAEPDLTQPPVDFSPEPEVLRPVSDDFADIQMDYEKPQPEKPDYDNMSEDELKKELSSRATQVKPYLKGAKEAGVDINHAKKLVSRAVSESKQSEFKVAVQLMDEGIAFAEAEFTRKISEDIENLAVVIRDLKSQGKDVSEAADLVTSAKGLLESGELIQAIEKLKVCLELVETLAY